MLKLDFHVAVQKLDEMISKRFDVNIQFISSQSVSPAQVVFYETVRRNAGAPLIVTHNNMLIPVRVEGSLVGAIRVCEISGLSSVDLCRIKETIDLVLEEEFVAHTLSPLPSMEEYESNVISFKRSVSEDLVKAN